MPELTIDLIREIIRQEVDHALSEKYAKGVSAEVAAQYLGISEDLLRAEAQAFRIPHVRIRGRYVFHIPTLNDWMREQGLKNAQGSPLTREARTG